MFNDLQLRTAFVRALDEVVPSAPWLESAVIDELHRVHRLDARDRGVGGARFRRWSLQRPGMPLAAALVLVAVVIAAAGAFAISRSSWWLGQRPEPAGPMSVERYQSLTATDMLRFIDANSFACTGFDDSACLPRVGVGDAAAKRWLDDLSQSQPPSKFAAVDYLIRHHLTVALAKDVDFVAAFHARDSQAEKRASDAFVAQMNALKMLGQDVVLSQQATAAAYTMVVLHDKDSLQVDAAFLPINGSRSATSCLVGPSPECASDVASIRTGVETFQGDLVKSAAPPSLVPQDTRLQADLVKSDVALEAVESAIDASNTQQLQTALVSLQQSLAAVYADAAAMPGA